jgi:hypothetical protein
VFEQGGDDAAGLTLAGADDVGRVRARKLTALEQGFEDAAGFRGQTIEPDFLPRPEQNARAQGLRL